jgi:hypothetical protein
LTGNPGLPLHTGVSYTSFWGLLGRGTIFAPIRGLAHRTVGIEQTTIAQRISSPAHEVWTPNIEYQHQNPDSDLMHSVFLIRWLNQLVAKWKDMIGSCLTGLARSARMPLSNGQLEFARIRLSAQAQCRQPRIHSRSVHPELSLGFLSFSLRRAGIPGRALESRPIHLGFSQGAGGLSLARRLEPRQQAGAPR